MYYGSRYAMTQSYQHKYDTIAYRVCFTARAQPGLNQGLTRATARAQPGLVNSGQI